MLRLPLERQISNDMSYQGTEGTCYAHTFSRIFINNIIKVAYPSLYKNIKTSECLFQFKKKKSKKKF